MSLQTVDRPAPAFAARAAVDPWREVIVGLSVVIAITHADAAVQLASRRPGLAVAMGAVAVVVAGWAAAYRRTRSRAVLLIGAAGALLLASLWMATRTVGVPIRARAGVLDSITTIDELVLAGICLLEWRRGTAGRQWPSSVAMAAIAVSMMAFSLGCDPGHAQGNVSFGSQSGHSAGFLCHLY